MDDTEREVMRAYDAMVRAPLAEMLRPLVRPWLLPLNVYAGGLTWIDKGYDERARTYPLIDQAVPLADRDPFFVWRISRRRRIAADG